MSLKLELDKIQLMLDWIKTKLFLYTKVDSAQRRVVKRGHVYWCYFGVNIGAEQGKLRPCVVLQNMNGNRNSSNTIVAPITHTHSNLNVVVPIANKYDQDGQLILDGFALLGNVITVSKARLGDEITQLTPSEMEDINIALAKSIDLFWKFEKYERIIADKDEYISKLKDTIAKKDLELEKLNIDVAKT